MFSKKHEKGLLIIMSGPSGVGKGTIRRILMRDKRLNLAYSISMTTRSPRNKEKEGVDYYYVSREVFDENITKGNLLEWAEFVGNKYGTPKDKVEQLRESGKNVILEIEVKGCSQVVEQFKGDEKVFTLFVVPPTLEDLEKRIKHRASESEEVMRERLEKARSEINLKDNYDYVIVNDSPNRAAKEMRDIIKARIKSCKSR